MKTDLDTTRWLNSFQHASSHPRDFDVYFTAIGKTAFASTNSTRLPLH